MKLKVVSDGTCKGTQVLNSETNERVEHVQEVSWKLIVGELPEVTVKFLASKVEICSPGLNYTINDRINNILKDISPDKNDNCNYFDVVKSLEHNLDLG